MEIVLIFYNLSFLYFRNGSFQSSKTCSSLCFVWRIVLLDIPPAGLPGGFTPGTPVSTQKFLDFIQKNLKVKF